MRIGWALIACLSCGGKADETAPDATVSDARPDVVDEGSPPRFSCDGGACNGFALGHRCMADDECCTRTCLQGVCSYPACTSDGLECTTNSQCCSFACQSGTCTPLDQNCRTLGNDCSKDADCCSRRCAIGRCQPSSYCGQPGDACSTNADCCIGACIKNGGLLGTCLQNPTDPASNCGIVDGVVCAPSQCGGACCSRLCAPWPTTGAWICQPPTGCHSPGDTCSQNSDCCGFGTGKVACDRSGGIALGTCRNANGCKPNGDICKLKNTTCNESCDCCSGDCTVTDTCKADLQGAARCTGTTCVDAGAACASSADCCGIPCVPDSDGGFVCASTACITPGGSCTSNADCCRGVECELPLGSARGVCSTCQDAGACALFGQLCGPKDCCANGTACIDGRCR